MPAKKNRGVKPGPKVAANVSNFLRAISFCIDQENQLPEQITTDLEQRLISGVRVVHLSENSYAVIGLKSKRVRTLILRQLKEDGKIHSISSWKQHALETQYPQICFNPYS